MGVQQPPPKRIAAIVTEYRRWSHADVIVGKILEGYHHDGREFPRLRLVSLFCDQFPKGDLARALAKRHNFRLAATIEEALTLGGKELAVDGVLSIGEHGNYPSNKLGQVLYPRRRFFEGITNVFARLKRSVPVFNDKHLAAEWRDARWMYDRALELHVPFLAGSSVPVTWRRPPLRVPRNIEMTEAVQIGYGGIEAYGFHALEGLQCIAERRRGGEVGVRSVQFLPAQEMWRAMDRGVFSRALLEAALALVPAHVQGDYRERTVKNSDAGAFIVEYRDGFKGTVAIMNGWVQDGDGDAFTLAVQPRAAQRPLATQFFLQSPEPFAHFAHLLRAIDSMMQTGHPPYPVERTLLTTGILDAIMVSKNEKNRRVETPHLEIRYTPTDWPFASGPVPPVSERAK